MKNKGITLIALVITIIILLILSGVTIGIAINGTGIFKIAKEAKDKYQNAQEEENKLLSDYENKIDTFSRTGQSSARTVLFDGSTHALGNINEVGESNDSAKRVLSESVTNFDTIVINFSNDNNTNMILDSTIIDSINYNKTISSWKAWTGNATTASMLMNMIDVKIDITTNSVIYLNRNQDKISISSVVGYKF